MRIKNQIKSNMAVTNQHIFDAINDLRRELKADMKDLRVEVDGNTNWRNQITGKLTILFVAIGVGVNFIFDWLKTRLEVK